MPSGVRYASASPPVRGSVSATSAGTVLRRSRAAKYSGNSQTCKVTPAEWVAFDRSKRSMQRSACRSSTNSHTPTRSTLRMSAAVSVTRRNTVSRAMPSSIRNIVRTRRAMSAGRLYTGGEDDPDMSNTSESSAHPPHVQSVSARLWPKPHQVRPHPVSTWHTLDSQALSLPEGVRACSAERQVHGSSPATPYTFLSGRPQPISVCGPSYDNFSALDKLPSTLASTPHCQRSSRSCNEAVAGARVVLLKIGYPFSYF